MTEQIRNIILEYGRDKDGYIDITSLGKQYKIRPYDYINTSRTQEIFDYAKSEYKYNPIIKENNNMWLHPDLLYHFLCWSNIISTKNQINIIKQLQTQKPNILEEINNNCFEKTYENPFNEKTIQQKLCSKIEGTKEIDCKGGRIDIITDNEIIEVKRRRNWKGALGQILVYGLEYPNHRKRIHLFRDTNIDKEMIIKKCSQFDVRVTFEEE